ncbi:hypothetical protein RvY_06976-2 [Ramazzottius varieornatus]|uniref:Complex 1 LYR protein domain-containing protein n=1 Tax=Ramazzottius varieornatus TaxID=947166 RepID=A0A1D1V932_RAMVA|nr:hypothetical protein RvY_06976-2 [Ramazzottius varieornatus]
MAAVPRGEVLMLYKNLLRASQEFSNYNFRSYANRTVKEAFSEYKVEKNPQRIQELMAKGEKNLEIIRRQARLGNLYSSDKLVIETTGNLPQAPERSSATATS